MIHAPPEGVSFDTLVDQYVRLRDAIKLADSTHKERMSKFRKALDDLNVNIRSRLQELDVQNVATAHGTAYQLTRRSATLADPAAFRRYIAENSAWALADIRANAPACAEFIETHKVAPPGVDYTETIVAGVERKDQE